MNPEAFRKLGHRLVDWIADYRASIQNLPVRSQVAPGDVKKGFAKIAPTHALSYESLFQALEQVVLPGITHWNHPRFFAYFPGNTSLSSVLADLVTAGLGAQGMSWQTSPAATEVEEVMMDWLRQLVGLSADFTGVIYDTASTGTLVALLSARERTTGFSQRRKGLQGEEAPLTVYFSEEAHSSVAKAALLAGFGAENLRPIETDESFALRAEKLQAAIEEDVRNGKRPCAIVASVGTTATTAFDPLGPLAQLAKQHLMWIHVDSAMAGSAMILPECRPLWEGVEAADSIVMNPHKWLGAGFDLSAYFVRDVKQLTDTFSTTPSYLKTTQDGQVKNFRDWGIPLGRRFRSLKLWFLFHLEGVEALQARLRRDMRNAQWLAGQVDQTVGWERMAPVKLQTVCLRHRPQNLDEAGLTEHNQALAERVNAAARAYVTPSVVKGRAIIRVSVGSEGSTREDVAAVWDELKNAALVTKP